jgi:very-short-patch-repair endonuclease
MIIVELDGDSHAGQERYDADRTSYLEAQGCRVIRYSNADVLTNLDGVLEHLSTVMARAPLPTLSPEGERA